MRIRFRVHDEILREIDQLLPRLEDLHKQATEDRSHYYTGSLLAETMVLLIQARYWLGPEKNT